MEEKILIKSEQYNVKKLCKILVIIGFVISLLMPIVSFAQDLSYYNDHYSDYEETHYLHQANGCDLYNQWTDPGEKCWECQVYEGGKFAYASNGTFYAFKIFTYL